LAVLVEKTWDKSLQLIKEKVGESIFDLWFSPIRLVQVKDGQATIEVPNRFFKEWIEDNHPDLITSVIQDLTSSSVNIKFKVAAKEDAALKKRDTKLENRKTKLARRGLYLNPRYTFDNFVVGPSNQIAQAAAMAVSDSPGRVYNPLFLYGGVGLGKTHLISAVGNRVIDRKGDYNALYVSAEQFTNEVVSAIRHQKAEELKAKYRNLDMLLIDDVQFVEGKQQTQEELFHTLNSLYLNQKQIVLSSDRPPREIKQVTDRLRSRFGMGLIADIQVPEVETRIAIIHKKVEADRLKFPEDVINFIALKVKSNIREVEGCIIRLGAHASLTGIPVDLAMARSVLKDFIQDAEKPLTVDSILRSVAEHYGIKLNEIKAKKRTKEVALPRQIAMYLARELTDASLSDIGKNIGGKNHATVIYAYKQIEGKRAKDENFDRMIQNLINKIKP
jgi:chromosomal replication initiator protein